MINIFKTNNLLRYFLGITFLSAGLYRIFNWQAAVSELSRLNMYSIYLAIFIIALEIIGGLLLILNLKTKNVLLSFIIFILCALVAAFLANGGNIISKVGDLFIFSSTPTDVFLHFTYLIILVYLLGKKEN